MDPQPPLPPHPPPFEGGAEPALDRYRHYLLLLARVQIGPGQGRNIEASDVVQQALMNAHGNWAQFRGQTEAERVAWLRRILANSLADAFRGLGRDKRDAARRRSLEAELEQSSIRLGNFLAADQSSPSEGAQRQEREVLLADALAALPEAQREALVLQYWHGWTLAQIATHLGRTPVAVAGLLKRGLEKLRSILGAAG
jgi:RNA polymerase sigma-70 factor (ECF subfamily)